MSTLKSCISAFAPEYEPYIIFLHSMLSTGRFIHSLEVGLAMGQAYKIYCPMQEGVLMEDWILAGLLHDIMKETPLHHQEWWAKKFMDPPDKLRHPFYLHGPASAAYARFALGICQPPNFFEAIAQHTGNFPNMSLFARCLHVADMTVPVRRYRGCKKLASKFYEGRLDEAELLLNTWAKEFLNGSGLMVDPMFTVKIHELTALVKPGPGFFSRE